MQMAPKVLWRKHFCLRPRRSVKLISLKTEIETVYPRSFISICGQLGEFQGFDIVPNNVYDGKVAYFPSCCVIQVR